MCFQQFINQRGGGEKTYPFTQLAGGHSEGSGEVGFPGAIATDEDDILTAVAFFGLKQPPFRTKSAGLSEQSRPPFRRKPATPLKASDKDYGIESLLEVIHAEQEIVRAQD